jgi:hypothetical protein
LGKVWGVNIGPTNQPKSGWNPILTIYFSPPVADPSPLS